MNGDDYDASMYKTNVKKVTEGLLRGSNSSEITFWCLRSSVCKPRWSPLRVLLSFPFYGAVCVKRNDMIRFWSFLMGEITFWYGK